MSCGSTIAVIAAEDHQVLDSPHHPSPSERCAVERSKRRQKPQKSSVAPNSRLKLRANGQNQLILSCEPEFTEEFFGPKSADFLLKF